MAVNLDFVTIPGPVLLCKIPDSAKILYGVIYALSQLSSGGCTASNATIMQIADIQNEKTLWRLLQSLEEKGLIKRYLDSNNRRKAIRPMITYSYVDKSRKTVDKQRISINKNVYNTPSKMRGVPLKNEGRERKQENINTKSSSRPKTESMDDVLAKHRYGGAAI